MLCEQSWVTVSVGQEPLSTWNSWSVDSLNLVVTEMWPHLPAYHVPDYL